MIGFGLAADCQLRWEARVYSTPYPVCLHASFLYMCFYFCIFFNCDFSFDIFLSFALSFLF